MYQCVCMDVDYYKNQTTSTRNACHNNTIRRNIGGTTGSILHQLRISFACRPAERTVYYCESMMNDPMAGMGAEATTSPATEDDIHSKEVFDPMILSCNLQRVERIRSVMGIASGCIAGIAGLTGWEGIGMFDCCLFFSLISSLLHS